jgi:hypothetical protein
MRGALEGLMRAPALFTAGGRSKFRLHKKTPPSGGQTAGRMARKTAAFKRAYLRTCLSREDETIAQKAPLTFAGGAKMRGS